MFTFLREGKGNREVRGSLSDFSLKLLVYAGSLEPAPPLNLLLLFWRTWSACLSTRNIISKLLEKVNVCSAVRGVSWGLTRNRAALPAGVGGCRHDSVFPRGLWRLGRRVLLLDGRDLTPVALFEGMWSFCPTQ